MAEEKARNPQKADGAIVEVGARGIVIFSGGNIRIADRAMVGFNNQFTY